VGVPGDDKGKGTIVETEESLMQDGDVLKDDILNRA
jgi:hypothetical protein